jgi:glycerophosphoryl diester phosphodiesterase
VRPMPLLIAHRGASFDAPENTLASVRLAWERDADAVEIDVHMSRDGEIVVIHDKTTKRIGGHDVAVAEQALAELRGLDAGSHKGEQWAGERIPTLAEVLETVPGGKQIFVEVKCGGEVVDALPSALAGSGLALEQVIFIGFTLDTMAAVKQGLPAHRALWLRGANDDGAFDLPLDEMIRQARSAGLDGLDLEACPAVDASLARRVGEAGMMLCVWTVDDADEAHRLAEAGVGAITTNRPAWLRDRLAEH